MLDSARFLRLAKERGITDPQRLGAMLQIAKQKYQRRVDPAVEISRQVQKQSTFNRVTSGIAAGAVNLLDTATFGAIPKIAGAIGGEKVRTGLEIGLEATEIANPAESLAGDLGGFFSGPASLVAKGGAKIASAASGGNALVRGTQGSGFAIRGLAQTWQNLAGGAGALTGLRVLEDRTEDVTIGGRIQDAIHDVSSPLNLGLSVATAGISAKFTRVKDQELARVIAKFEMRTGQKVPPDVATNSAKLQDFMDSAARDPGTSRAIERMQARITKAFGEMIDDMARSGRGLGKSVDANAAGGARAARRVSGSVVDDQLAAAAETRRGLVRGPYQAEKLNLLTHKDKASMLGGLREILVRNSREGKEALGGFQEIVKKTMRFAKGKEVNVAQVETLLKEAGRLGFGGANKLNPGDPRTADAARRMARGFYAVLNKVIDGPAPTYASARRAGEVFRKMEKVIQPEKVRQLETGVMRTFWSKPGLLGKNGRLEQLDKFNSMQDSQSARGWLFHRLVDTVVNKKTGLLNEDRLHKVFSANGMFNREVIDKALPGIRQELMDLARLSTRMKKGAFRAEGSQTAGRVARSVNVVANMTGIMTLFNAMVGNPHGSTTAVLGAWGLRLAYVGVSRQVINGKLGAAISETAKFGPQGLQRLPGAAQEANDRTGNLIPPSF